MRQPPRSRHVSILGGGLWQHAIWVGLLMAGLTLLVQAGAISQAWHWQTMTFSVLALMQLAHAMAVRSERESTLRLGLRTNMPLFVTVIVTALIQLALIYVPALQPIFETEALGMAELAVVLLIAPLPFIAVEIEKWFTRRGERGTIDSD